MKKWSKVLSIIMASAMVLSAVGCGKSNTTDNKATETTVAETKETEAATANNGLEGDLEGIIPKDTVTLTVYSQLANYSGEQIGWFGKVIQDKFNVKLNIVKTGDGVFATRMESGNLGDIVVFGNDSDEYKQAVEGQMLLDWEKEDVLKDFGPYIEKNMKAALEKNRKLSGGVVYGFGHDVGSSASAYATSFYRPDIRWDLYKQLGYPEVNTLEDFIPILEKMQQLEPKSDNGKKTYGASLFKDWDGNMVMFVKSTAALYGWDEFGFGVYNVNTGEYQDVLQKDGMYLRMLKFYNTLFQKGLLDPDSMTQTYDDMNEDYKTGGAFFNIFDWMGSGLYNTPEHKAAGKAMMPLAAKDQKNVNYGLNVNGGNRVWTIGSKTQYPELCMAIINWLSTPEGVMTYKYGPKGINWDYDKDGKPFLTEQGENCQANQDTEVTGNGFSGKWIDGSFKINNTTWADDSVNPDAKNGDTFNYKDWESRKALPVSAIEQDWRDKTGTGNTREYMKNNDHVAISVGTTYSEPAKSNELNTTWNQVKEAIKSYSWKAIYAKSDAEFDSIVKEMTDKVKSYGYDECVKFQQNEAKIRKGLEDQARSAK